MIDTIETVEVYDHTAKEWVVQHPPYTDRIMDKLYLIHAAGGSLAGVGWLSVTLSTAFLATEYKGMAHDRDLPIA